MNYLPVTSATECKDAITTLEPCSDDDTCLQNKWQGAGGPDCVAMDETCGFKLVSQEGAGQSKQLQYLGKTVGAAGDTNFNIGPDLDTGSYEEVVIKCVMLLSIDVTLGMLLCYIPSMYVHPLY